ncbi:MAG TPA: hypothetical protein VMB25_24925 [Bryobacteraceae bacterium]|nr:hypothetical protein [Bryobacteraceae bacterium]
MNTMSRRTQRMLEELRRAINDAISQSDAVGNAMAALVEAGVKAPVSIDVALFESLDDESLPAGAGAKTANASGLTAFDKKFLQSVGIANEDRS